MKVNFKNLPKEIVELARSSQSLEGSLKRLEDGTQDTKRSWFFEDKDPKLVLADVQAKLSDMKDLKIIADWDLSKSDKFAPQGGSAPLKDRLDLLDEYFINLDSPPIIKDPIWKKAKLEATRLLKFNESGSPISGAQVVERGVADSKYNTSSGYPLFIKRKKPEAQQQAIQSEGIAIKERYPFVLGYRAQMGKTGKKARFIFMAPMALNVHGQRFLEPLQDYIRRIGTIFCTPWEGWNVVQSKIDNSWTDRVLKFGTDYSKMDQHFNQYHALEVFDVIKHYFRKEFWSELEECISYAFSAPVITNLGYIDQPHALLSGSEWTNFLETLWDFILVQYLRLKYHVSFALAMGIGDDQLWLLNGSWQSKKAKEWILKVVVDTFEKGGTPGNPEKQEVDIDHTTFLQRFLYSGWRGNGAKHQAAGVYSLIRNLTSQIYPEFYHNDKDWDRYQFAIRTIMIAENCNEHPLFQWYVKEIVAKSNRNILEFAELKDREILAHAQRSKNIANFLPTYNQTSVEKPLVEFETMKILRSLIS